MNVIIDENHHDRLRERIASLEQERDQEQKLHQEWRAATLAEQSKVTQLVAEKAMLIFDRDQLRAKLALLTDPAAVHVNILRGDLPLTKAQAIHIAGLPADMEQELERLRAEVERLNEALQQAAKDCLNSEGTLGEVLKQVNLINEWKDIGAREVAARRKA